MTVGITHSLAEPDAIAAIVRERYGLPPIDRCELVRSYVNDVYRLVTGGVAYYVKVYRRGWRNAWDARWECQFLRHLDAAGVTVSVPAADRTGVDVQEVAYPEGERALVLYRALPGAKPVPPWTPQLYRSLGIATARMHEASRSFHPSVPGRVLGPDHLIRRPLAKLHQRLANRGFDLSGLTETATRVAARLDRLTPHLPYGAVHGDLTLDNIHVLPDGGIAFYDFDLAGHGWFAFDGFGIHRWAEEDPVAVPFRDAFLEGYATERNPTPGETEAWPLFEIADRIWDLEHTVANWTAWSGTWMATDAMVHDRITAITENAARHVPA